MQLKLLSPYLLDELLAKETTVKTFRKILILSTLAYTASSLPANADIAYKPSFSGNDGFTLEGRSSIDSNGIRIQGGPRAGSALSPTIDVSEYTKLMLSFIRNTNRLDNGEAGSAQISVNGGSFTTLESTQSANGQIKFPITSTSAIRSVALRFTLNASSFFERYTISDIVIEGDRENCSENCGPNEDSDTQAHTVILPDESWTCSLPAGIPDPKTGTLVFKTTLASGQVRDIGLTPYGHRKVVPVNGGQIQAGSFGSSPLTGSIAGNALDSDLYLPSGAIEHESRYVISTADRTLIYMRNCGVADGDEVRFVADFEAPANSRYAWLNNGTFVGTRKLNGDKIELEVYANTAISPSHERIQVLADNDLRQQTWECPALDAQAREGRQAMTLQVGIGGFQTVGNSKYGNRRIIGITGGSFNGDISGNVNPGGADYQLTRNGDLSLEARYTITPRAGEPILVRNCGDYANSDLTLPIFEARVDGPYNWLNDADYVGTITPGLGRVTIRVFDSM